MLTRAIILAASAVGLLSLCFVSVNIFDEGVALVAALRIANGEWPYRDFFAVYPPAQFAALAALFKIFGPSLALERVFNLAAQLFLIAMLIRWARTTAVAPLAVAAFHWAPGFGYAGLPALALVTAAFTTASPYLSGALLGLAFVWKHEIAIWASLALAASWLLQWPGWRPVAKQIAAASAIPLATLGLLLSAMPFSTITDHFYGIPKLLRAGYRALPLPPFPSWDAFLVFAPAAIAFIACAAALRTRSPRLLAFSLWAAAINIQAWSRPDPAHLLPPLLLASTLLASLPSPWLRRALFLAGILLSLRIARDNFKNYPLRYPDQQHAVAAVQRLTLPADAVYVGTHRHDRIYINDISFYFFAARPIPTFFHELPPGIATTEPAQRRIIAELESHNVRAVVLTNLFPNYREPNAAFTAPGSTLLDEYIAAHYTSAEQYGPYAILLRR